MSDEQFITYEEALSELAVSNDEMKKLIQQGELAAYRTKGKMKFKMSDIQRLSGSSSSAPAPTLVMGGSSESNAGLVFDDDGDTNVPVSDSSSGDLDLGDDSSSQDLVFDFDDASAIEFLDSGDSAQGESAGTEIPTIQFDSSDGSDPLGGSSSDILPTADLNFDDISDSETINFDTSSGSEVATMQLDDVASDLDGGFAPTIQMDDSVEPGTMQLDDDIGMDDQTEDLTLEGDVTAGIGPTIEEDADFEPGYGDEEDDMPRSSKRSARVSQMLGSVQEVEEAPIHVVWAVVSIFAFIVMALGVIVQVSFVANRNNEVVKSLVDVFQGKPQEGQLPGASNHVNNKGDVAKPPKAQ